MTDKFLTLLTPVQFPVVLTREVYSRYPPVPQPTVSFSSGHILHRLPLRVRWLWLDQNFWRCQQTTKDCMLYSVLLSVPGQVYPIHHSGLVSYYDFVPIVDYKLIFVSEIHRIYFLFDFFLSWLHTKFPAIPAWVSSVTVMTSISFIKFTAIFRLASLHRKR